MDKNIPLKISDQVEVGGIVYPGIFRIVLRKATLYSVGASDPTPPLSVTADQATTGSFDGMLVEIEGRLMDKQLDPQNTLRLDLSGGNHDSAQS